MSSNPFNLAMKGLTVSISRKVFKHGNSLAVTLPWTFVRGLKITAGKQMFLQITKAGNIVLSDKPLFTIGSFTQRVEEAVRLTEKMYRP